MQDEVKALQLCQNKVRQKKLPMEVVDAEYQWWVFFFFAWRDCVARVKKFCNLLLVSFY